VAKRDVNMSDIIIDLLRDNQADSFAEVRGRKSGEYKKKSKG
jgi:hypothetical protein